MGNTSDFLDFLALGWEREGLLARDPDTLLLLDRVNRRSIKGKDLD